MARLSRVVAIDVPHHVTQRGNARQIVFGSDPDRLTYLNLLRENCDLYNLSLLGYCLMTNHAHLVAIPRDAQSLALALKHTHGRYATFWNARCCSSGHVWQGRFYSCPLDGAHVWTALRYVELNPVRAGMVEEAARWKWSSAAVHCGEAQAENWLDLAWWQKRWTAEEWLGYLAEGESPTEVASLRRFTHTGRPLGSATFVAELEQSMLRPLSPRKRGRRTKPVTDCSQQEISFVA
jgi:putative transposase